MRRTNEIDLDDSVNKIVRDSMNDLRSNDGAMRHEDMATRYRPISATLVLSLSCLVLFLGGLFTMVSPALFQGGVMGLRTDYAIMEPQARGFSTLIDGFFSIVLGVVVTLVSSLLGILVGVASGLKSLSSSARRIE